MTTKEFSTRAISPRVLEFVIFGPVFIYADGTLPSNEAPGISNPAMFVRYLCPDAMHPGLLNEPKHPRRPPAAPI